jgi:hypothetical protein
MWLDYTGLPSSRQLDSALPHSAFFPAVLFLIPDACGVISGRSGMGPGHRRASAYEGRKIEGVMTWKVLVGVLVVVLVGAIALAIYGSQVEPSQQTIEQVVPNDRFQN